MWYLQFHACAPKLISRTNDFVLYYASFYLCGASDVKPSKLPALMHLDKQQKYLKSTSYHEIFVDGGQIQRVGAQMSMIKMIVTEVLVFYSRTLLHYIKQKFMDFIIKCKIKRSKAWICHTVKYVFETWTPKSGILPISPLFSLPIYHKREITVWLEVQWKEQLMLARYAWSGTGLYERNY